VRVAELDLDRFGFGRVGHQHPSNHSRLPLRVRRLGRRRTTYGGRMCRNITTLRGLEPAVTPEEIEAAARQYVRKVSGVQKTSEATEAAFERAVELVASATAELLAELPPRKVPPTTEPPLRRLGLVTP
jgi:hypothetical protein